MQQLFDFVAQYVSLNEDEKNYICSLDIFHEVKKGSILLQANQKTSNCYFVLKGCVRTYYIIDGEEKTSEFYTEMDTLTPQCIVNKKPSEYSIACVEDSLLLIADTKNESASFAKYPKFETLCRIMTEEFLAKEKEKFDLFKFSSPEQRFENLLAQRPDLIQRVPQHQLASYLGITPQSLSRLKSRFYKNKKSKVIS